MHAFILLANGFEEIEAIAPIDILRRAGVNVTILSIHDSLTVKGAHGVTIIADAFLNEQLSATPDLIITPGGIPGSEHLRDNTFVTDLLKRQADSGRYIAAICASPIALDKAGVLADRPFTCYPGFEAQITSGRHCDAPIVVSDKLITAQGPGVALTFGLTLVELLVGPERADELKQGMLIV